MIRVTPSDPQTDWWYSYLGFSYVHLGRYGDAADAFRNGLSLNASLSCSIGRGSLRHWPLFRRRLATPWRKCWPSVATGR